jgi:UDP-GlcNAc:undecaprenyl-phosphate/decaprenyl-phosphate GlcNAc-1-phosphate transferase
MYNYYILIFLSLAYLLLFKFYYIRLTNFLNLYDIPDFKRKIHYKKVSLAGGLLIYFFLYFILFFDIFYLNKINTNLLFVNNRELITFAIFSTLYFLVGIYDDKFNLVADKKLFLYFFITCVFLTTNESLLIQNINFSFLEKNIVLSKFSFFFTAFAILLFINSLNMFDGINLQSGLYIIFFLIILFFKFNYSIIFLSLIIILLFFLYLNNASKIFLGENGISFLGFFLSYFSIFSYNNKIINYADEVFLIMCIPGFDLLRLSITRLISGKHPFSADKNHIHHKLLKKYNQKITILIVMTLVILPYLLFLIFNNILLSIFFSFLLYSSIILKLSQKKI